MMWQPTIFSASPATFGAIRYAGAAWLVWLGIGAFRAGVENESVTPAQDNGLRAAFVEGFLVNVLNPKAPIFFVAFLPQFVDPGRGAVGAQVAWLGGLFAVMGMFTDSAWALAAHAAGRRLARQQGFWRSRHYLSGSILCSLGVAAAIAAMRA